MYTPFCGLRKLANEKIIRLGESFPIQKESQLLEIPRQMPLVARDVVESLLFRDSELARRDLKIHQPQNLDRREITY